MNQTAKDLLKSFEKPDPEVETRIREGIESNRKGFAEIQITGGDGKPVPRATVRYRLKRHGYHFGCNLFMLDQFPEAEKNAAYEKAFSELFNLAVLPFYWSDFEQTDGAPRFGRNSAPVYRRPPPERCLDYCKEHGITPKGHPLLWHQFWPGWLQGDIRALKARVERRFSEIAARFGTDIPIWDVANEAQTVFGKMPIPGHVDFAFRLAERYFTGCTLTYNDDRLWWNHQGDYSPVYLLVKNLQLQGRRVDALGFQYHMFDWVLPESQQFMNPRHLLSVLDQYTKLGIPVNLSEISLISRRDLGDGDEFQSRVLENLYRVWFSHRATNGAIWWNLVDGTAAGAPLGSEDGENRLRAGLLNYDLTPKKAYVTLKRLLQKEWHTEGVLEYEAGAPNQFRGFHGEYEIRMESPAGNLTTTLHLGEGRANVWNVKLGSRMR